MEKIKFIGFKKGIKKISLTNLIHTECNLSLTKSKLIVDNLIGGEEIILTCLNSKKLIDDAKLLGVIVEENG